MKAGFRSLGARSDVTGRRIVALTDMLELGDHSEALHAGLAEAIENAGIDLVFTAGKAMQALDRALPAERRGGWAADAAALAPVVTAAVRPGDVVMVKGSNGSKASLVAKALAGMGSGEG
jgi:UDP-N-acetylmuramoyl-tripeptide--D-alanyl-D-alanine ligase